MKKILFFLLTLAILLPWAANAQETVTIGDGTVTCNSNPIGTYFNYSITEQLYTAEEIGMAGTIESISFYYMGTAAKDLPIHVYMMNVDATNLSTGISLANADEVFDGTLSVTTTAGWVTINLSRPFVYDGTSNLLIGVIKDYLYYFSGQTWQGTAISNMARYTQSDSDGPYTISTTPGSSQANRPNIQLVITPNSGPTCEKPSTFEISNFDAHSASFAWANTGAASYTFEYKKASASEWTIVPGLSTNTYTMSTLDAATDYTARVKAVCGTDFESGYKTVNFTTPCETISTFPWTEDFTGLTSGIPNCWDNSDGTTTNASYKWNYYNAGHTAAPCLRFNSYTNSDNNTNFLKTPVLNFPANKEMQLVFGWKNPTGGDFSVFISTDGGSTYTTALATDLTSQSSWKKEEIDLTNFVGSQNVVIVFKGTSNYGSGDAYIYLDDVAVREKPNCLVPTALAANNIATNSAELSWTANSNETAWTVYYKKTTDENYTEVANATNPYTLNGLTAATNYQYYVVANCSANDASEPSEVFTFATECDVIAALGYTENFDSYTVASNYTGPSPRVLPTCWKAINTTTYSSYSIFPTIYYYSSTNYANSTPNSLKFYSYYSSSYDPQPQYAILPEMNGLAGTLVQLKARGSNASSTFKIGTMSNPTDASTFTMIAEQTLTTSYPTEPFEYIIPSTCADSYLAIMIDAASSGRTTNGVYIDDIAIIQAPTCPKPQNLAVTANSVTAHEAVITWTPGDEETTWIVQFATNADFEDYLIEQVENDPTLSFRGLDPETTYYVRVYANCGEGNESQYSNVVNFTTGAACVAPTGLTATNLTATSATLSWTESGESASWQICLNDDEENLINATATTWPLENLTSETVYTAKVRGICNGEPTSWSSSVSFEPTNKLVIGSGTSTTGYLPTNTNYDFSYTQQIYTVAELGEAGVIESIDFYMTSTSDYDRDLDIYMVSTDKSSFTDNTDWIAVTDADLVFSGNVNFIAQSWNTITLDEGFIYDGTKNVAIIVDDNSDKWSSRNFLSFAVGSNQAHYCYQDNTNIDPSAPSASYKNVTTSKNQIRILKSALPTCMKPTGLAVNNIGGHSAQLSWTSEAEAWQVQVDEETPIDVTENPYTLTGLDPQTEYSVKVRANCDVDGYSDWTTAITFTTDVACPTPTNVAASHVTNNSAEISWGGNADSYNVQYGQTTTLFFEGFEDGIPSTWTTVDADEDGNNWLALSEIPTIYTAYSDLSSWAHNGNDAASSPSYYNTGNSSGESLSSNHWLITPQVPLQGTLKFYAASTYSDLDSYEVLLSTTGTEPSDFTVTLQAMKGAPHALADGTDDWEEVVIDLSSYSGQGYIAIHHVSEDKYFLVVDDFGIYSTTWQTTTVSENNITLTGLTAETPYEVQVQANCGNVDGVSQWSSTSFTTLEDCAVPYELEVSNITATSAQLSWTGAQESYNVEYGITLPPIIVFEEDFEDETSFANWTFTSMNTANDIESGKAGLIDNDGNNSSIGFRFSSYSQKSSDETYDQYLVSPELTVTGQLKFYAKKYGDYEDYIYVGYSTTTSDLDAFTWDDQALDLTTSWTEFTHELPTNVKYFAFHYFGDYKYYAYVDDITINNTPTSESHTVTVNANSCILENLNPETHYYVKVQGVDCDGEGTATAWSETESFETGKQPYILYFNDGNGICLKDTMFRAGAIELPDATSVCEDDYILAGWSLTPVNAATSEEELELFTSYTPTQNTVLYAVYTDLENYSSFPACDIMPIPYSNDFESEAPDYVVGSYGNGRTYVKPAGWTIVSQDPLTTRRARPQVFYTTSYAHSGNFSLRLDSAAVLAMPRLADDVDVSQLTMELYVRQPNADQYLEIGVMTDLSNPNSFESVATINNETSSVDHWTVNFSEYENDPELPHYIAFRNVGTDSRSINNIDDISIYFADENLCEIQISDLPYSENFDDISESTVDRTGDEPECWTVAYQYAKLTKSTKPQVFHTRPYAHSGYYSLRMEGQCIYAMPKFADDIDISSLQMELYVRQPYAHDQLEVGVMTDLNDPTTFTAMGVINNGSNGVEQKLVKFSNAPEGVHYIAFRNLRADNAAGKSINNIDDIVISVIPESDPCEIQVSDLDYTENFDNISESTADRTGDEPECWTVAHQYAKLTNTTKPQVFYTRTYAHSDYYSLRLEGQCIYVMPKFADDINISGLSMELYVRQPYSYDQLEVGVMTDINDPATFTAIGEPINTTPKKVEQFVIDFAGAPAGAHYIAFRNSKVDGGSGKSINNIDDISIFVTGTRAVAQYNGNSYQSIEDDYDTEYFDDIDFAAGVDEFDINDFTVYPNPTTGMLTLGMEAQRVEMLSLTGQQVALFENTSRIDISNLPSGVYILKATLPQGTAVRKVVKR